MSSQQIIFGLLEFLVSILISFILIFGSYRIILVLTRRADEEKQLKKKMYPSELCWGAFSSEKPLWSNKPCIP